ncbi:MAG: hypothetical protein FJ267_00995, partial [Planctomycetes bacterium]|nr:hypothetical protein [Planctomycetota bacterium]
MATKPLRLLHAANLRLDCPLQHVFDSRGEISPVPDDVLELISIATLTAFDRLIDLAIERDIDALLITGNTFEGSVPSLSAEAALRIGLDRLYEHQIPVFVTPGTIDPANAWEDLSYLPNNVHVFKELDETPIDLSDRGRDLATILPVSVDSTIDLRTLENLNNTKSSDRNGRPFLVGLLFPSRSTTKLSATNRLTGLDWLACNESDVAIELAKRDQKQNDESLNVQSGPQGLSFNECGPRGATLLEVDGLRNVKETFIPLCPVRWERLTQSLDGLSSKDDLLERMLDVVERQPELRGELVR